MGSPTLDILMRLVRKGQPNNEVSNERLAKLLESGLWDAVVDAPDYRALAAQLKSAGESGIVMIPLAPTTFGKEIKPPFEDKDGWDFIADGPGDELLDLTKIAQLPMLEREETVISFEEAVRRSVSDPKTNWGQRAAFRLRDVGNAGKISEEVFPVRTHVVCGKTQWRHRRSSLVYAWYVYRDASGFDCGCGWSGSKVDSDGRRLARK